LHLVNKIIVGATGFEPATSGSWDSRTLFYFKSAGRRMSVDLSHKQKTLRMWGLKIYLPIVT